jgi:hypothetical protein
LEHNLAYEIPLKIQYKLRISNRLDIVPNLGVAFRGFILPTSTFSVKSSSQSNNNTDAKLFFIKNEYKSGLNTGLSSSLSLNYSFSNLSTLGFKIDFGYSFTDLAICKYTILESEEDENEDDDNNNAAAAAPPTPRAIPRPRAAARRRPRPLRAPAPAH